MIHANINNYYFLQNERDMATSINTIPQHAREIASGNLEITRKWYCQYGCDSQDQF